VNRNTDAEHVAAWRYIHGFFERAGASNIQWVWNPNTLRGGSASAADHLVRWQRLYPGDAYVDWTGLDLYNTGPLVDGDAPYRRPFETVLREPHGAMNSLAQKPILLGEVGSSEVGGDKAQWVEDGLSQGTLARYPKARAVVWFDIDKAREQNWAIQSSSGAHSAFIAALRQSFFMADASGLMPSILAERRLPAGTADLRARLACRDGRHAQGPIAGNAPGSIRDEAQFPCAGDRVGPIVYVQLLVRALGPLLGGGSGDPKLAGHGRERHGGRQVA
jgi:hypothetical protein